MSSLVDLRGIGVDMMLAELIGELQLHPCPHPGGENGPCLDCSLSTFDLIREAQWTVTDGEPYIEMCLHVMRQERSRLQPAWSSFYQDLIEQFESGSKQSSYARMMLVAAVDELYPEPCDFEARRYRIRETIAYFKTCLPMTAEGRDDWTRFEANPEDPPF